MWKEFICDSCEQRFRVEVDPDDPFLSYICPKCGNLMFPSHIQSGNLTKAD